ncbi:MAG: hypothetical protein ACRAVC_20695 [Trichormus sp.]
MANPSKIQVIAKCGISTSIRISDSAIAFKVFCDLFIDHRFCWRKIITITPIIEAIANNITALKPILKPTG